ncbi:MAG: class I SAM-dependent methyltransferase [bacterium]
MSEELESIYCRDREVWDSCAATYEKSIVGGHPEVTAYEAFEEDFIDQILLYLIRDRRQAVQLFDVGCGSARLHLRYGLKAINARTLPHDLISRVLQARTGNPSYTYDPYYAEGLRCIGGVDFSAEMIALAKKKLSAAGLGNWIGSRLRFQEGSAFDLEPMESDLLPVVVTVCNSVGVMQGPLGAMELFQAMRRAAEEAGGIAVISGYRKESVETFALGNYESTMNVCGQPRWLEPKTYAAPDYVQVPRAYKRAYDTDPTVTVEVFETNGTLIEEAYVLKRDPAKVAETIETGHIRTHTDYESYWYSFEQFDQWIAEYWPNGSVYHIAARDLDVLRGEPAQLAILDCGDRLRGLSNRWGADPHVQHS